MDRGIKVAFLNGAYLCEQDSPQWTRSSPQHALGNALEKLFPKHFFDFGFAVVRDPISRFRSAFKYQKHAEGTIACSTNINDFIESELHSAATTEGAYDNHFHRQVDFLIPEIKYNIFRLENGMNSVKKHIDKNFRVISLKHIGQENKARKKPENITTDDVLSDSSITVLNNLYAEDLERFGYNQSHQTQMTDTLTIHRPTNRSLIKQIKRLARS